MPTDRVVFWDIDGTLIEPSMERLFLRFLRERGLVTPARLAGRFLRLSIRWPLPPWYRVKVAYLRGEPVRGVSDWIDEFWQETARGRLQAEALRAIRWLGERGATQVLLSGTLEPLARKLAEATGIREVIAGRLEIANGRYSGALVEPHPHGDFKRQYAESWLSARGCGWDDAAAVGDHYGDRFLLAKVKRPLAVNAHPDLRREAARQRWHVAETRDLLDLAPYLLDG